MVAVQRRRTVVKLAVCFFIQSYNYRPIFNAKQRLPKSEDESGGRPNENRASLLLLKGQQ